MKNYLALTLALTSLTTMAATTGTLLLKGTVLAKLSITVTPEPIALALPLETSQTDTKVAEVNEKSNSSTGYKVTISSANAGNLVRTSGTELFPYTLKYDSVALNLASAVVETHSGSSAVDVNKDVTISYTGVPAEEMVAGDYTDTITFTIAAN